MTATALLNQTGKDLWSNGWTDPQIAKKIGCSRALVCMWRKRNHLPANAPAGSEDWDACRKTVMRKGEETLAVNDQGDVAAAKALKITTAAFRKRRWRMGLKPGEKG